MYLLDAVILGIAFINAFAIAITILILIGFIYLWVTHD